MLLSSKFENSKNFTDFFDTFRTLLLRLELLKNVLKNNLNFVHCSPAAIQTPIFEGAGLTPEVVEIMAKAYPVRRIGSTPETSAAILFAASPGASFVTGSHIFVDGGLLATASGSGSEVNE